MFTAIGGVAAVGRARVVVIAGVWGSAHARALHTLVTDGAGVFVVADQGDGLVGEMPTLEPGSSFSYNSFHVIHARRAIARGSYIGLDESGRRVLAAIPAFEMVVPDQPEVGYA